LDDLTFTGGLRESWEHRSYDGYLGTAKALVANGDHSWNALTPRASLMYAVNDQVNIYASYNQGFKSGAFNPTGLSSTPVSPEKVKAYEAGVKTSFSRFTLNFAAYHYDIEDLQLQSTVTSGGVTHGVLQNAAAAKITGLDLDGVAEVTDSFELLGGLSWLITDKYSSFPTANVNVPNYACPGAAPCGNVSTTIDATGFPLIRTPHFTGSLQAQYTTALANGTFVGTLAGYVNSGFSWEAGDRVRQGSYGTLGLDLSWQPGDSNVQFTVYGRNLTNSVYINQEADSAGGDAVSYAEPRNYGIKIQYKF
jgi:iron complex outermembrane receptor protein